MNMENPSKDQKRVLIVDDALIIRRRIRDIAESVGWQVAAEAVDGEQAVTFYQQHRPDLVTMDIVMPQLDGVAALEQIKEYDPTAKVAMVSAVDQRDKLSQCIGLGAVDFIVKPFDADTLRQFFQKYLELS